MAIWRTEIYVKIAAGAGNCPGHPHNGEVMLNTGMVGLVIVLIVYGGLLLFSAGLCRNAQDPLLKAAGGAALASIGALVVAGVSGQHLFLPTVAMWCFVGIVTRAWVISRYAYTHREACVSPPWALRSRWVSVRSGPGE